MEFGSLYPISTSLTYFERITPDPLHDDPALERARHHREARVWLEQHRVTLLTLLLGLLIPLGLVLLGTVPTGLVGLLLQHPLERLFHDLRLVTVFLMLNGGVLWLGEILRRRARHAGSGSGTLEALTSRAALGIGAAQILALIPGFSRSGLTLATGLSGGLSRAAAAEFAFLLGTPIILAAGVLELPKLFKFHDQLAFAVLGGILTGGAAYLSVRFLMRYFSEGQRMYSFALYCVGAGALSLIVLLTRG